MENSSVVTLDYLLDLKSEKKKKEPSKIERDQFYDAWIKFAIADGYSDQAERYLYNGSVYCGAKPLKAYIDQVEDKQKVIKAFFKGKLCEANADTAFRLLSHLFALLLNDKKTAPLASTVVKQFPYACQNKNGKRLGSVETTLLKHFFSELDPNVTLLPLNEMNIEKQVFITDFISSMETALENINSNSDNLSKRKLCGIAKVKAWIADYQTALDRSQSDTPTRIEDVDKATVVDAPKPNDSEVVPSTHNSAAFADPLVAETSSTIDAHASVEEKAAYFVDLFGKLRKVASSISADCVQQKIIINTLTSALEAEKEKLRVSNQRIFDQNEIITDLRQKLVELEGDILALKKDIAQRDAEIAEKDAEISERIKMADVLSRDRTKQADEALQRLASRIKIEYQDFQDVAGASMSCDLGENLRLQLQGIFDILEKGGMKIK